MAGQAPAVRVPVRGHLVPGRVPPGHAAPGADGTQQAHHVPGAGRPPPVHGQPRRGRDRVGRRYWYLK